MEFLISAIIGAVGVTYYEKRKTTKAYIEQVNGVMMRQYGLLQPYYLDMLKVDLNKKIWKTKTPEIWARDCVATFKPGAAIGKEQIEAAQEEIREAVKNQDFERSVKSFKPPFSVKFVHDAEVKGEKQRFTNRAEAIAWVKQKKTGNSSSGILADQSRLPS